MTDKSTQTTDIANELLKRADTIGAWLQGKIDPAVDFAAKQAADIAQQYVVFGMVYQTTISVLCILALIFFVWAGLKWRKYSDGFSVVLGGMSALVSGAVLCSQSVTPFLCGLPQKSGLSSN